TARDAANNVATTFTGTASLSGQGSGGATNTILGSPVHSTTFSRNFTLGYSFTPTNNITVTHVRHYYGTKVTIWTDGGTPIVTQNVTSIGGTWQETPLATPVQLLAGVTYRVGVYTGGAAYYWTDGLPSGFPNGVMVQGYEIGGD